MIKFKNVHKHFKDLHVINGVNLEVKQGEVVVVCGPSGSGKSTLIRTVNQLERIESGEIWSFWNASAWRIKKTRCPASFQAVSSNVWRLHAVWRWSLA